VLFAALAFKSGVNYEPPVIGNVKGSGPAWIHDMTGAEILAIGDKPVVDYFTYMDFAQEVVFHGDEAPLRIKFKRYGSDEIVEAEMTPQKGYVREAKDLPLIGVSVRMTPVIGKMGAIKGNAADLADPPLEPGDVIVEVNGHPIKTDIDLRMALARDADKVATFVLERKKGKGDEGIETITSKIPTNPMRTLGFSVQWLPIAAIKLGSPAEKADLKIGDEIVTINGDPRGDLLTLDKRMIQLVRDGGSVELGVKRDGKLMQVAIEPVIPKLISDLPPNKPIAIDSLGVAVPVNLTVEVVEPDSPAALAGLQENDKLVSVKYLLSDEQKKQDLYSSLKKDPLVEFGPDDTNWAEVLDVLQRLEAGTEIEFSIVRGGSPKTLTMKTEASTRFFQDKRGFPMTVMQKHYKSDTWAGAFKYGALQVRNDIRRVGTTLAKLIRGKISPTNLGGPGTIAMAATSEASQGTSRLLLFLTFLSANLAIVNFLPIPILDGGHMLFLAYEGIFRRPVSERVQIVLTYAGLVMILGLMLFVIFLDVGRISSLL
jgi:regulator of sigma E protease